MSELVVMGWALFMIPTFPEGTPKSFIVKSREECLAAADIVNNKFNGSGVICSPLYELGKKRKVKR